MAQRDSLVQFSNAVLNVIKARLKDTQKYKLELSDYQETDNLIAITLLVVLSYNQFGNINNSSGVFKQLYTMTGKVSGNHENVISINSKLHFLPALRPVDPPKCPVASRDLPGQTR